MSQATTFEHAMRDIVVALSHPAVLSETRN
jgi:hypothetical protein